MADSGDHQSESGKGEQKAREDDQTWAKEVQGAPWGLYWMSHKISSEEIK